MLRLLRKQKQKRYCETCDGEPENKKRRVEEPHIKKGFMLILNHEVFDDKTLVRPGTKMDEENLIQTFSKFNFEIQVFRDLTYQQIKKLAKQCTKLYLIYYEVNI